MPTHALTLNLQRMHCILRNAVNAYLPVCEGFHQHHAHSEHIMSSASGALSIEQHARVRTHRHIHTHTHIPCLLHAMLERGEGGREGGGKM